MIQNSISRALDFLAKEQLPYGEFRTYLSTDESMLTKCVFDSSPFCTALIIYCISFLDEKKAKNITQKAVQFLLEEKEEPSLWRFWSSKNRRHKQCPPDLDDITCISYVLKQYYSPQLFSLLFASNINVILNQKNKNGLFKTFIASNLPQNPIDSVVNANVLLYLGESEATKEVSKYLCNIILNNNEAGSDSCYADEVSLYYFVSRAYFNSAKNLGVLKEVIIKKITVLLNDETFVSNSIHLAMAICSLLNFQYYKEQVLSSAVQNLLDYQKDNGAWSIFPLWSATPEKVWGGDASDWRKGFWGSEELTTAFCIEALVRSPKEQ